MFPTREFKCLFSLTENQIELEVISFVKNLSNTFSSGGSQMLSNLLDYGKTFLQIVHIYQTIHFYIEFHLEYNMFDISFIAYMNFSSQDMRKLIGYHHY